MQGDGAARPPIKVTTLFRVAHRSRECRNVGVDLSLFSHSESLLGGRRWLTAWRHPVNKKNVSRGTRSARKGRQTSPSHQEGCLLFPGGSDEPTVVASGWVCCGGEVCIPRERRRAPVVPISREGLFVGRRVIRHLKRCNLRSSHRGGGRGRQHRFCYCCFWSVGIVFFIRLF